MCRLRNSGFTGATENGFTILEIMVVVFLMAMMAGITAVAFVNALPQARMKSDARDLVSTIKYARNIADAKNERQIIRLDLNTASYALNGKVPKFLSANTAMAVKETADSTAILREGTYSIVYDSIFGSNWNSIILNRGGKTIIIKSDPVLTAVTLSKNGQKNDNQ